MFSNGGGVGEVAGCYGTRWVRSGAGESSAI